MKILREFQFNDMAFQWTQKQCTIPGSTVICITTLVTLSAFVRWKKKKKERKTKNSTKAQKLNAKLSFELSGHTAETMLDQHWELSLNIANLGPFRAGKTSTNAFNVNFCFFSILRHPFLLAVDQVFRVRHSHMWRNWVGEKISQIGWPYSVWFWVVFWLVKAALQEKSLNGHFVSVIYKYILTYSFRDYFEAKTVNACPM